MINPIYVSKHMPREETVYHVIYRRVKACDYVAFEANSLALARKWIDDKIKQRQEAKNRELADADKLDGDERDKLIAMIEDWYPVPVYEIVEEKQIYKVVE